MISNKDLANYFENIALALEEQEEDFYRIRAYRRAAKSIRNYPTEISDLIENNIDLTVIPNIGEKLSEKIKKTLLKGDIQSLPIVSLATDYPPHLQKKKRKPPNFKIYTVMARIDRIIQKIAELPEVNAVEGAGEYRRRKETLGDIDIVVDSKNPEETINKFQNFLSIRFIINKNQDSITVQLKIGIRLSLHFVESNEFAAHVLFFTGTAAHYKKLQTLAKQHNLRLSKKGLFDKVKKIDSKSEEEIYHHIHLAYIPPELRENRGEIEAAAQNSLPKLIELADIKGDLHSHTNETDGRLSLQEMVLAARKKAYAYVAITDHSQSLKITHGMDEKRLLKQIALIDQLNANLNDFRILKSMEVDILEDGTLDLSNDVLKELDLTVCSIHSKFRIGPKKQTLRLLRAMDNPYFNILGHATGRLLHHRAPYKFDMEKILMEMKERNCIIEINAQPARLDINDEYCLLAKERGVKVAISSDAHSDKGFDFMILGVNQARRGWLTAQDVINTYDINDLIKILRRQ